jgi:hypothetical protein
LGSIIEEDVHIKDTGLFMGDVFVDLILAVILEVIDSGWIKGKLHLKMAIMS